MDRTFQKQCWRLTHHDSEVTDDVVRNILMAHPRDGRNKVASQDRRFEIKCYRIIDDTNRVWQLVRKFSGKSRAYHEDYYEKHKSRIALKHHNELDKRRLQRRAKRIALMEYLGGKCAYCAMNDYRALQFDHIHGGGIKEIKRFGSHEKMCKYYYNHLDEAKTRLQILCGSCNMIKRWEKGEGCYRQ